MLRKFKRPLEVVLEALYRSCQQLLPGRFRRLYGSEMRSAVRQRLRRRSARALLAGWLSESADVVRTAMALRLRRRAAGLSPVHNCDLACREGVPMLEQIRFDTRLAVRALTRAPGFCAVVLVTLALGIGATTTIFSFVNAVLIEPLPYAEPDDLVIVWETDRLTGTIRENASIPDFRDFAERNEVLEGLAAFSVRQGNLTGAGARPQQVTVAFTTYNFLEVVGVTPVLGRTIDASEDLPGGPLVTLVSHNFWSGALARDPEIIGSSLRLDDQSYEVIGVLPPGINFPAGRFDLMAPMQPPADSQRARHGIQLVGRLKSGATLETAQHNFTAIAADLEEAYPSNRARGAFIEPLSDVLRGEFRPALLILMAAVITVLLIACANVAGLLLARGAARRQEIAVCAALGAGARQIARRFLIEALLLSVAGAVAGVALAFGSLKLVAAAVPAQLISRFPVALDWRVLVFVAAASLFIGVAFGLLPLRQVLGFDLLRSLQTARGSSGGLQQRVRRLLVIGQVALAMVLLVGAALLMKSLWELRSVDPGFRADQTLRATFRLPSSRYPRDFSVFPNWTEVHTFNRQLLRDVEALPGVRAAALSTTHPLSQGFTNSFVIVGRESEARDQGELRARLVTEDYLRTVGIGVVAGRSFTAGDDTDSPPVLLLNEAAVRRYFSAGDVIGQQISFWGATREVVGIVADVRMQGLRQETPPAMYVPLWQTPPTAAQTLLVWASQDPIRLAGPIREAIWNIDPELAVYGVTTMQDTLKTTLARERLTTSLLIAFGATALLLAAIGLHGLLSYLVVLRRHEMGVRMALGASRSDVFRLVVSQGGRLALAGIAIGLPVSLLVARLLEAVLYGVSPTDPVSLVAAVVLLAAAALTAIILPARKAGAVDPTASLRAD